MNVRLSGFFLFFLIACGAPLSAMNSKKNLTLDTAASLQRNSQSNTTAEISTAPTTLSAKIGNCLNNTWNTLTKIFSHKNQENIVAAVNIIMIFEALAEFTNIGSRNSKQLSEPFPEEIATAIEKIGMQNRVTVHKQATGNIGFALPNRSITIDPEFYAKATPDERLFTIGHELVHLRDHHHLKLLIFNLSILYLAPRFLNGCKETIDWTLTKAHDCNFVKNRPHFKHYLDSGKKVNAAILKSPFVKFILQTYCISRLAQHFEKTCDLESARILNVAKGGISFFKNLLIEENQTKTSYFSYLNPVKILNKTKEFFRLESHPPLQDRIQYLENYIASKVR